MKNETRTVALLFIKDHTRIFRSRSLSSISTGSNVISAGAGRYTCIAWLATVLFDSNWVNCQLCWTADVQVSRGVGVSNHVIRVECRRQTVILGGQRLAASTPQQEFTIDAGSHRVAITALHSLQQHQNSFE